MAKFNRAKNGYLPTIQFRESVPFALLFLLMLFAGNVHAQDNYEIQVYSSPTMPKHSAIFELHSNYTFIGEKEMVHGVIPSQHALHETLEITTGLGDNFELGLYLFTNATPGYGYQFVGTHLRPRVKVPDSWKWPVGVSLSAEFGYQKAAYSAETWNVEIRPIVDKQWDKFYVSFNPTLGVSLKGDTASHTPVFEPNLKLSYQFFKKANLGLEYYGSTGYVNQFDVWKNEQHDLYAVYDLAGNDKWELNVGMGFGLTQATDKLVGKVLVGRRINWGRK